MKNVSGDAPRGHLFGYESVFCRFLGPGWTRLGAAQMGSGTCPGHFKFFLNLRHVSKSVPTGSREAPGRSSGTPRDLPMATSSIQVHKVLANLDPNSHTYTTDEMSIHHSTNPPIHQFTNPPILKGSDHQSPRRESRSENNPPPKRRTTECQRWRVKQDPCIACNAAESIASALQIFESSLDPLPGNMLRIHVFLTIRSTL